MFYPIFFGNGNKLGNAKKKKDGAAFNFFNYLEIEKIFRKNFTGHN
jgi:hypothetical protein